MENTEERKVYSRWSTLDATEHIAAGLREDNPEMTEDEAFEEAMMDQDAHEWAWQDFCEDLTNLLYEVNPDRLPWAATVEGFGWRSQSGSLDPFSTMNGQELLWKILPNTECAFKVYHDEDENCIRIDNAHHDKPMGGEWYTIRPHKEDDEDE